LRGKPNLHTHTPANAQAHCSSDRAGGARPAQPSGRVLRKLQPRHAPLCQPPPQPGLLWRRATKDARPSAGGGAGVCARSAPMRCIARPRAPRFLLLLRLALTGRLAGHLQHTDMHVRCPDEVAGELCRPAGRPAGAPRPAGWLNMVHPWSSATGSRGPPACLQRWCWPANKQIWRQRAGWASFYPPPALFRLQPMPQT
jgi:hypothetical protein